MREWNVVTSFAGGLRFHATHCQQNWLGELLLTNGSDGVVAHFRKGQWGAFWDIASRPKTEEREEVERDAPPAQPVMFRGPLTPKPRPELPGLGD